MNSYYEKFSDGKVVCIDDEIPFEIPNGWEWCRLSNVIELLSGQDFIPEKYNSSNQGIPYITGASNIVNGNLAINRWTETPTVIGKLGDLLIVCKGSGVGKMCICNVDKIHIARQIQIIRNFSNAISLSYVKSVLEANLQTIISNAQGVIPGISREHILNLLIPLPPTNEQYEIDKILQEILPFINRYAKSQEALDKLNVELLGNLKNSILQEAVQGRLVQQIAEEGTGEELLEQIKLGKQQLIKEGKLKKSALTDSVIFRGDDNKYFEKVGKTEQDITDEIPFEIPDDWKWCRIGSVLNIWSARRVHERDWRSSGIPFYRAREIGKMADWGHVDNDLFIEQSLYDEFSKSGVPQIGDLMMTAVGTLGKTYVVETNNPFYYKDGSVLCIGNPFRLNPNYLKLFFESSAFANQYLSESDGTTVATLTMVRLNRYLIPVPPLKEQTRIVEKIKTVTSIMRG